MLDVGRWSVATVAALAPGQVLDGKYRVLREIGSGAMGLVYEAVHVALGRRVAIKTLRADTSEDPDLVLRFEREARAASAIGHPHIVDVFDLGHTADGALFMVMEILAGRTLADWLKESPRLPVATAIDLMAQILSGLAAAHREGIVHRDLKPENIFIIRREDRPHFVKIVDFGISKILVGSQPGQRSRAAGTAVGTVLGTPLYMSPEQILGQVARIDHRSDIYSAGVVLYEMLCGRTPFEGESQGKIFASILDGWFPLPHDLRRDLPFAVGAAILRALDRDMEKRFASAADMREALTGRSGDLTPAPELVDVHALTQAKGNPLQSSSVRLAPLGGDGSVSMAPGAQTTRRPSTGAFAPLPQEEVFPALSREFDHPLAEPAPIDTLPLELERPVRAPRVTSSPERSAPQRTEPSPSKRWIGIALAVASFVVVGRIAISYLRSSQQSSAAAAAQPYHHRLALALDPSDANVQIDQLPAPKEDLFVEHGRSHVLFAEAPGRIARKFSFNATTDLTLTVRLGRKLPLPMLADPEPLPLELAARYPESPASHEEIARAFSKLNRYAKCLALLGYGDGVKARATAPSASDMSGCVQLLDEASSLSPEMFQLAAAGRAYLQGARGIEDGRPAPKLLSSFRAHFLAVESDWQMEELARQEKDDGQSAAWHMRNLALQAQLWWRKSSAHGSARASEADRAALKEAYEALHELAQHSPQQMANIAGAEAFMKAAAGMLAVANEPRAKPEASLRACRELLAAFNATVVE
jgi:serine/threonine protein kinase